MARVFNPQRRTGNIYVEMMAVRLSEKRQLMNDGSDESCE